MTDIAGLVGRNIARMRKVRGLTQQELADSVSVTRKTINSYENGSGSLTLETLRTIANALGMTESELIATEPFERWEHVGADELLSLKEVLVNVDVELKRLARIDKTIPEPLLEKLLEGDLDWELIGSAAGLKPGWLSSGKSAKRLK
jgi:transcriptional regulator with XRE-family HTH domain